MNWASTCTSTSAVRDGSEKTGTWSWSTVVDRDTNRTPTGHQPGNRPGTQMAHKRHTNWHTTGDTTSMYSTKLRDPGDYMLVFFHHNHSPSSMSNALRYPAHHHTALVHYCLHTHTLHFFLCNAFCRYQIADTRFEICGKMD